MSAGITSSSLFSRSQDPNEPYALPWQKWASQRQNIHGRLPSDFAPPGLAGIGQMNWPDAANGDDRRFVHTSDHPVRMRLGDAAHERVGRHWGGLLGDEVFAACYVLAHLIHDGRV
jgi:hypothetical protein